MIEVLILGSIWFTLFLGVTKLRVDLNTLNENLMEAAKLNKEAIEHLPDCMSDVIHDRLRDNR